MSNQPIAKPPEGAKAPSGPGGAVAKMGETGKVVAFPNSGLMRTVAPPRDMGRQIWLGMIVIAIAFGGLGGWAAVAPLDAAVTAQGTLVVESKRKTVQHYEGGIVKRILVRDGSKVKEGDTLIELDGTRAFANLNLVQADLDAELAVQARLVAERDGASSVTFPPDLLERAKSNPVVADAITTQQRQFYERARSIQAQIAILQQRVRETESEIAGLQEESKSREDQIRIYVDELKGWNELYKKGYFPLTRILQSERDKSRLEGELGTTQANIARSRGAIGEAKLQIEQTKQRQREEVISQLRDVQAQIADNRQKIIAASDVTTRLNVVAPASGVVQGLKVFTPGTVIGSGAELMQIVPVGDKLEIDAQVTPQDIEALKVGQTAEVRFSALKGRTVPSIDAIVDTISSDRLEDQRSGAPYYMVHITIPPEEMAKLDGHNLVAGMPAEVMIKVKARTALEYMIRPLTDNFAHSLHER